MKMFERKEEALANAAKNKSSEQVSLVLPSKDQTINQADEEKIEKVERQKIISDCGSSLAKPLCLDIYMALIDREWMRMEERLLMRLDRLVKEKMEKAMELIKMNRESIMIEESPCRRYQGRSVQCSRKDKDVKRLIGKLHKQYMRKCY